MSPILKSENLIPSGFSKNQIDIRCLRIFSARERADEIDSAYMIAIEYIANLLCLEGSDEIVRHRVCVTMLIV